MKFHEMKCYTVYTCSLWLLRFYPAACVRFLMVQLTMTFSVTTHQTLVIPHSAAVIGLQSTLVGSVVLPYGTAHHCNPTPDPCYCYLSVLCLYYAKAK